MSYLILEGAVQNYEWGGYDYLAELTGHPNPDREPRAELWLGAHDRGPARLANGEGTLGQVLQQHPETWLGTEVVNQFAGKLPFLLKVLDIRSMLSIQTHPTRAAAAAGYDREEAAQIPLTAPTRNYRDRNHKPEMAVALTDFYLLHGFRPVADIRASLFRIPGWAELVPILDHGGLKALYQHVMELPQSTIDDLLAPLRDSLNKTESVDDPGQPDYWARRAFAQYTTAAGHLDRGIFSIYWLNLVHLNAGEGIFQAANVPHAYLRGVTVELMANSDNVLRGGLTQKHIDVPELLNNLDFSPVRPQLVLPQSLTDGWRSYETPAEDFFLARIDPAAGESVFLPAGPAIYLLLAGELEGSDGRKIGPGQGIFLGADTAASFAVLQSATIFRAGVPRPPGLG